MEDKRLISFASEECNPYKEVTKCSAPYYMLHFIKSGFGYFNGIKLGAGDGFLVKYGNKTEYYPDKEDPWSYAWINFSDKDIYREILATVDFDSNGIFKYDVSFPYYKTLHDLHNIKWLNHLIVSSYDEAHLCACAYHIIMSYLLVDKYCKNDRSRPSHRENHVRECERFIENNYHRQYVNVNFIAEKLHLSRAYLRNLFVEYKGVPPQQFLLDFRMKRASEFLDSSDMPIGVVASSVGYTDQFQFSKIFKKQFGMSPKEYRNREIKN